MPLAPLLRRPLDAALARPVDGGALDLVLRRVVGGAPRVRLEASPDHAHAAAAAHRPRGPRSAAAPYPAPPPRSRRKRSWVVSSCALIGIVSAS